jgi:hypothetical protein
MSTTKPSPKPATLAELDALLPGIIGGGASRVAQAC